MSTLATEYNPEKVQQLSYKLIEEIGKDRYVDYDTPLYKRLRYLKDLIDQGADPNYVKVDREYRDTTTPLEVAILNGLCLHVALLMHEGARIYDIEREAINNSGTIDVAIMFRIVPELRKYHKWGNSPHMDTPDKDWEERVQIWREGSYFELDKDPEILHIILNLPCEKSNKIEKPKKKIVVVRKKI